MKNKLFFKWYGDDTPKNVCECILSGGPFHGEIFLLSFDVNSLVVDAACYARISMYDFIYSGHIGRYRLVFKDGQVDKYLYGYMWE